MAAPSRPQTESLPALVSDLSGEELSRLRAAVGAPAGLSGGDADPYLSFLAWASDDSSGRRLVEVKRHLYLLLTSREASGEPGAAASGAASSSPDTRTGTPLSAAEIQRFLSQLGKDVVEALEGLVILAEIRPPDSTLLFAVILKRSEQSTGLGSAQVILSELRRQKGGRPGVEELLNLRQSHGIGALPKKYQGLHLFEEGIGTVGFPAEAPDQIEAVIRNDEVRQLLDTSRAFEFSQGYTGGQTWSHHLLAVLLGNVIRPPAIVQGHLLDLGFDLGLLREELLGYIVSSYGAGRPSKWLSAWREILGVGDAEPRGSAGRDRESELVEERSAGSDGTLGAPEEALREPPPIAGYAADVAEGPDLLDIQSEVEALSSVIAAKAVRPPLSIGLFGDWGSGKSFFMARMHDHIERLAARSAEAGGDSAFCSRAVQIRFNAWHYNDADLWACLVSTIFEELFAAGAEVEDKAGERERLVERLCEARGIYDEAARELEAAQATVEGATRSMSKVQRERHLREVAWRRLGAALEALGQMEGGESFAELRNRIQAVHNQGRGLGRRFAAVFRSLRHGPHRLRRLGWLLLFVSGSVVLAMVAAGLLPDFSTEMGSWIGGVLGLIAWLGRQLREVSAAFEKVETAAAEVERLSQEQPANGPKELIAALREREEAAAESLRAAQVELERAQQAVDDLSRGRIFKRFVEDRSGSADYRQRLGLISLVRRDFEHLSRLLDPAADGTESQPPPVERIVLYIDDLDRCRPERVVQVLEALQLLLALPLFVVVVAVDPRWLRHSLQVAYPELLTLGKAKRAEDGAAERRATPQDYLEKIFQIPYALQPLEAGGFEALVRETVRGPARSRSAPEERSEESARRENLTADEPWQGSGQPPLGPERGADPGTDQQRSLAAMPAPPPTVALWSPRTVAAPPEPDLPVDLHPAALELEDREIEFMTSLAPFVRTPRAAKRLVNLYRLFRASLTTEERAELLREEEPRASYRVALLVLAVLSGFPDLGPRAVELLASSRSTSRWKDVLISLEQPPEGDEQAARRLSIALKAIADRFQTTEDADAFEALLPKVARYSYSLDRIQL